MKKWDFTPTVYVGTESFDIFKEIKDKNILLVNDPFLLGTTFYKELIHSLKKNNEVEIFTDVVPDPPIELVVKGIKKTSDFLPNIVIAIGGGSAIDLAKAVVFMAKEIIDIKLDEFIAIPTTSGTGSEVTNVAVITDSENNVKYPIADDSLLPTIAILDFELTKSAPDSVIAYSGLDVLTHALEALVAKNATTYTDALAEKAIEYVFKYLKDSYNKKDDDVSKSRMHEASCLAGMSFNAAGLGTCHAIAHQIGAHFKLVHGLANTILLPHVVKFNANNNNAKVKYANIARKIDIAPHYSKDEEAVNLLIEAINKLALDLKAPMSLAASGVDLNKAKSIEKEIINNAYNDMTIAYNPVDVTKKDLEDIYRKIFQ